MSTLLLRPSASALLSILLAVLALAMPSLPQEQAAETTPTSRPATAALKERVLDGIAGGVSFFLRTQNKDGSFGRFSPRRGYEVMADVPGSHDAFRAAVTSLVIMALRGLPAATGASESAADRAVHWLVENCRVRRPNGVELYNTWAFGYGLQSLASELRLARTTVPREKLQIAAESLIAALQTYQTLDGGWGYYDFDVHSYEPAGSSTTFTTATVLVALKEAELAGLKVPPRMLRRALLTVRRGRKVDGSYIYGDYLRYRPVMFVNAAQGSTCRTQACHLALDLFDQGINDEDLRSSLVDFFKYHAFERMGVYRPVPHSSWYQISGYFYLYGHYYAALNLEHLPVADQSRFWPSLIDGVFFCRQKDATFWDYPFYNYHKSYGTAFALLILSRFPGLKE